MIVIRNWRDTHPTIAHQSGIDWRLLSNAEKTSGDIEVELEPEYQCLKAITYISYTKLQPHLSYEPHYHKDHEEVYYIINGKGKLRLEV